MNWILCLTKNNLHLTRNAVKTFLAQDIRDIRVLIIDDDSTDGTLQWAWTMADAGVVAFPGTGSGVAAFWNMGLGFIFGGSDHALVVNNDVELRPDTYRHLLADGGGFVTAVGSQDQKKLDECDCELRGIGKPRWHQHCLRHGSAGPDPEARRPHPDFSCFLIRKEIYLKVGPFNENFKGAYVEDGEYHLRMHRAGVKAICLDLPFYHIGAGTLKNASPEEERRIQEQAGRNRAYFREQSGVEIGSPEYYALFGHGDPEESQNERESDSDDKARQD